MIFTAVFICVTPEKEWLAVLMCEKDIVCSDVD
jgi:hypothetical protein